MPALALTTSKSLESSTFHGTRHRSVSPPPVEITRVGIAKRISDSFKKAFLESIKKPDSQIFTEDLRNMIMSASNDEEIHGVIQAVKK